jgi:hypothetical protein
LHPTRGGDWHDARHDKSVINFGPHSVKERPSTEVELELQVLQRHVV